MEIQVDPKYLKELPTFILNITKILGPMLEAANKALKKL